MEGEYIISDCMNEKQEEILVIGSQLQKARETLELTLEEVAKELNTDPKVIFDWEEGVSQPTLEQLENLSKIYGRNVDYFLKRTPNPPQNIQFRTKPGQTLRDLSSEARKVISAFDELCRTALELENLLGKKREIKISHTEIPIDQCARELRRVFNKGDAPIRELRSLLENLGIRIFEMPIPRDEFSGFSLWHSEYGPCILINAKEPIGRRNFTVAHELAHLLYGHGPSICHILEIPSKPREEYNANQFAVELLLPRSGILRDFERRRLTRAPTEKELGRMANKWGVSIQALGYRLENLGLVEKGLIDKFLQLEPIPIRRRTRKPSWERVRGEKFVETAFESYQKGFISLGKLASSLGIPVRKAIEEVERRTKVY